MDTLIPRGTKITVYDILATIIADEPGETEEPTRKVLYQVDPARLDDFCDALKGICPDGTLGEWHRYPPNRNLRCIGVTTTKLTATGESHALAVYAVPPWSVGGVDWSEVFTGLRQHDVDSFIQSTTTKPRES